MVAGGLHHHHGDDAVNVRITWVGGRNSLSFFEQTGNLRFGYSVTKSILFTLL